MVLKVSGLPQPNKPATERTYTVADWLNLPERPHLELVEGALQEVPNSTPNHDLIIFNLRMALSLYVMANRLGRVLGEVNVIIEKLAQPNGWIPDALFISNDNPAKISSNVTGIPDWVLEVWVGGEKTFWQNQREAPSVGASRSTRIMGSDLAQGSANRQDFTGCKKVTIRKCRLMGKRSFAHR